MKITYYTDPGHGWFKVPKKKLKDLGIEKTISHFSYVRGDYVYLEEDSDAGKYFNALKSKGIDLDKNLFVDQKHTNRQSKIRSYLSYEGK